MAAGGPDRLHRHRTARSQGQGGLLADEVHRRVRRRGEPRLQFRHDPLDLGQPQLHPLPVRGQDRGGVLGIAGVDDPANRVQWQVERPQSHDHCGVGQLIVAVAPVAGGRVDVRRHQQPHLVVDPQLLDGHARGPREHADGEETVAHVPSVKSSSRGESSAVGEFRREALHRGIVRAHRKSFRVSAVPTGRGVCQPRRCTSSTTRASGTTGTQRPGRPRDGRRRRPSPPAVGVDLLAGPTSAGWRLFAAAARRPG